MAAQATENQLQAAVVHNGYNYATLDFTAPQGTETGTQKDYLALPAAWMLVPDEPDIIENVVAAHPWGTHVMVLANGKGYYTQGQPGLAGQQFPGDHLGRRNDGSLVATTSSLRILIRSRQTPIWNQDRYCAELAADLWADRERCFADCQVLCADEVIPCHRAVLAKASPVFERMLSCDFSEAKKQQIRINGEDPELVQSMLKFAYTGKLSPDTKDVCALLCLADCYEFTDLVQLCADAALENINAQSVATVIRAFRSRRHSPVMQDAWSRLMELLNRHALLSEALLTL